MNILRLAQRLPPCPGGKELHVQELTRQQVAVGHQVHVVFAQGELMIAGATGSRVRPFASWLLGRRPAILMAAAFAASARSANSPGPFDIVHAHGDFPEAIAAVKLARRSRAASVMTVHGAMNPRYARLAARAFKAVDRTIALGQAVRFQLLDLGVEEDRVAVMSSGVDLAMLDGAAAHGSGETGAVVAVGALDKVKGFDVLLAAAGKLADSDQIRIVIIGDGPERNRLEATARGLGIDVTFTGHLSRPETYRHVARAACVVAPSRRLPAKAEGTPTAVLEAMALGRCCIVSEEAGTAGVIEHDRNGLVVGASDPDALAAALRRVLLDSVERHRLGNAAAAIRQRVSWSTIAHAVEDEYAVALASRR